MIEAVQTYTERNLPLCHRILFVTDPVKIAVAVALFFLAIHIAVPVILLMQSENYIIHEEAILGGDFVVFWTTARELFHGNALAMYNIDALVAKLNDNFALPEPPIMTFSYPPIMFLIIAPLGVLGYLPALLVWWGVTLGIFIRTLSHLSHHRPSVLIAIASTTVFQAAITGQTGFLTATLLIGAAYDPARRAMLAGAAAGLLLFKPQFGLLIPVAYAAAGYWRAFGYAALFGMLFAAISTSFVGLDAWSIFHSAIANHGDILQSGALSNYKLSSVYGAVLTLNGPSWLAFSVHTIFAVAVVGAIVLVWRKAPSKDIRIISLCAGTAMINPYIYFYEMTLLIPALLLLAKRGATHGWLNGERTAFAALWIAPVLILSGPFAETIPYASFITACAAILCARRIHHELIDQAGTQTRTTKPVGAPS